MKENLIADFIFRELMEEGQAPKMNPHALKDAIGFFILYGTIRHCDEWLAGSGSLFFAVLRILILLAVGLGCCASRAMRFPHWKPQRRAFRSFAEFRQFRAFPIALIGLPV